MYIKSCLKGKVLQLMKIKFEGGTYYQGPF